MYKRVAVVMFLIISACLVFAQAEQYKNTIPPGVLKQYNFFNLSCPRI
jgi:hypothetical protein